MAGLTGKVALIGGGASAMGAADARDILESGGRVVIGDRLDVTSAEDWQSAIDLTIGQSVSLAQHG